MIEALKAAATLAVIPILHIRLAYLDALCKRIHPLHEDRATTEAEYADVLRRLNRLHRYLG